MKFLKAFAAARISTFILAIFDRDAVGLEGFTIASQLQLPENIRVMRLPDIDLARTYPTIGPQGTHEIDVNNKAVSMELFLGRHNLITSNGSLIPIFWNNYVQTVQTYQGVIQNKADVLDRFLKETNIYDKRVDYCVRFPRVGASVGAKCSRILRVFLTIWVSLPMPSKRFIPEKAES